MKQIRKRMMTEIMAAVLLIIGIFVGATSAFGAEPSMQYYAGDTVSGNTPSGNGISDNEIPSLSVRVLEQGERYMILNIHAVDEGSGIALIQADNDRVGIRKTLYRPEKIEEKELVRSANTTLLINANGCYNIYAYDGKGNEAARAIGVTSLSGVDISALMDQAYANSVSAKGSLPEGVLYAGYFREGKMGDLSYEVSKGKGESKNSENSDTSRWRKLIRNRGEIKEKVWSEGKSTAVASSSEDIATSLFRQDVIPEESGDATPDPYSWKLADVVKAEAVPVSADALSSKKAPSPGLLLLLFPAAGLIAMMIIILQRRE